jgi:hypothetical protein
MKSKSASDVESDFLASEAKYRQLVKETLDIERRGSIDINTKLALQRLNDDRRLALREMNRLLSQLRAVPMAVIVVMCVSCGKSETVQDTPEHTRDRKCKDCGESMLVKRPPGDTDGTPNPTV